MQKHSFTDWYKYAGKVGEGQHASVYKCFKRRELGSDDTLPTPYAMKIIRSDDEEKRRAHVREFEILQCLSHPNICAAVEIFEDKLHNVIYQVMAFIDGQEILDTIAGHHTGLSEAKVKQLIR